jgi:hypothetical protein
MHVHIRCLRVAEALVPIDSASAHALKTWKTDKIHVELQDERRMHTRQQEKFWYGVVVPIIAQCWKSEKGWAVLPDKSVVHGRLVGTVFGMVDTPLGPERRSSTTLTLEEYGQLIEYASEYLKDKYNVIVPEPGE